MSQRQLLFSYSSIVVACSCMLGSFIACGAKNYRVPIHGEESETTSTGNTLTNAANLFGVHSSSGWKAKLPIVFYTSTEIPQELVMQLTKAMETWESAVGMRLFEYRGAEESKGSDYKRLYDPLDDSINSHYMDYAWTVNTGKSKLVLATTIWENDPNDQSSITKADIRYNSENYYFGDSLKEYSPDRRIIVDLESLALHELGHLLGLSHVQEEDDSFSVMNSSLFIGEGMITRRLSVGDIDRVRSIYGVGDPQQADGLEIADEYSPN